MALDIKSGITIALVVLVAWLGWRAHQRSSRAQAIHGGALSQLFNFLSGVCFVAILPSVCASVLVLHPPMADIAGFSVSPIIMILVGFALLSLLFSLLFALVEKGPLERARQAEAESQARGWTEEDARTSGL